MRRRKGGATGGLEETHLDLGFELLQVATVDNLSLTRLETINDRRNRSHVIGHREEDELLVDKVGVWDEIDGLIEECSGLEDQI